MANITQTTNMISLPGIEVTNMLRKHKIQEAKIENIVRDLVAKSTGTYVFNFGKYRGKNIGDVYAEDRNYLVWLAKELTNEHEKFQDVKEILKDYV